MDESNAPATKGDLAELKAELKAELNVVGAFSELIVALRDIIEANMIAEVRRATDALARRC